MTHLLVKRKGAQIKSTRFHLSDARGLARCRKVDRTQFAADRSNYLTIPDTAEARAAQEELGQRLCGLCAWWESRPPLTKRQVADLARLAAWNAACAGGLDAKSL